MSIRKGLAAIAAAAAAVCLATSARADITPTLISAVTSGAVTTYTYNLTFANGSDSGGPTERIVQNNSYVSVYDFLAYVPGSLTVSGPFSSSIQYIGQTPTGVLPTDDASIYNFMFLYTGPTTTTDGFLGTFSAQSELDTINTAANFTSHVTKNSGLTAGTDVNSIGFVALPGTGPRINVPEPSSLGTLAMGIIGLGALGLLRRRRVGRVLAL